MKNNFSIKGFLLLLIAFFCLSSAIDTAHAGPAYPGVITVTQPDGSTLKIRMHGDEHFGWATTQDGKPIAQKSDGYYYYANYAETGAMSFSSQRVTQSKSASGEAKFLTQFSVPNMQSIATRVSSAQRLQKSQVKSPAFPNQGEIKSAVILVEFTDVKFVTPDPNTAFDNQLNQEGYSVSGATGSARDYFKANSKDQFLGDFDVYGPYTLSRTQEYYGGNNTTTGGDMRPQEMILDAVTLADADGVDFSQYDFNSDGEIDNIFVYYAGYSEAEGGPSTTIWPHKWNVEGGHQFDGKTLNVYACTSELRGASGSTIAGIGTFCHEFSHVFGLFDHYDTSGDTDGYSYGLGYYDIMTIGSYNNDGNTPPLMNALEMEMIGWIEPLEFESSSQNITLEPIQNHVTYKVPTEVEGEYFLIENRCQSSIIWDQYIPGSGLIITHVDMSESTTEMWENNMPNGDITHECFRFIPANGETLVYGTTSDNFEGVPYPYNGNSSWTPFSFPKAQSWNGKLLSHEIVDIAKSGENATFTAQPIEDLAIYGSVKNTVLNNPIFIAGATITISPASVSTAGQLRTISKSGSSVITTTSDEYGSYKISTLDEGTYTIEVSAPGYISYTGNFTYSGSSLERHISLFGEDMEGLNTVGYHNRTYGQSIGVDTELYRTYISLTPEMLKKYIGTKITHFEFYAVTAFTGYVIIQNETTGTQNIGQEITIASSDMGWKTVDLEAEGNALEILDSCAYKVMLMVNSASSGALPISLDNDESLQYDGYSNRIEIGGTSMLNESIYSFSGNTVKGNLMIAPMMTSTSTKMAPSQLITDESEISIAANLTRAIHYWTSNPYFEAIEKLTNTRCDWVSSDTSIAIVDDWGNVTALQNGVATITATSVVNPDATMTVKVTVTDALPAKATGSVIHLTTREAVDNLEMKFTPVPKNATSSSQVSQRYSTAALLSGEQTAKTPAPRMLASTGLDPYYATTNSEGTYNVDLGSGFSYIVSPNLDPDNGKYYVRDMYTNSTVPYVEGDESTINQFQLIEVFDNPIYEAAKFSYYGDCETPGFTAAEMYNPIMYAIKLPKEELADKIGHKIVAADVTWGEMLDPYVQITIAAFDGYKYSVLSLTENEYITGGSERFQFYTDVRVQPETDYYITAKFVGSLAVDTENPVTEGCSNLVWDNKGDFVPATELGLEAGNWFIDAYVKPMEIDPVTSIELAVASLQGFYVGVPTQIYASVLPESAIYKEVTWSSSNEAVATIDESGFVTFLKEGEEVTFTATSTQYTGVSAQIALTGNFQQGISGYTISSDQNYLPGTILKFYPLTKSESAIGPMPTLSFTRAANSQVIEVASDDNGSFFAELPVGAYDVECSYEGLEDLITTVDIKYGMNVHLFELSTFAASNSTYKSWTTPEVYDILSDVGSTLRLYSKWTSEDLKNSIGENISRIQALVWGIVTVNFTILDLEDPSEYLYRSEDYVIGDYISMVSHDIPASEQVTIEDGKTYLIGFELSNYDTEHYPAIISSVNGKEAAGKGDIYVYSDFTVTTLAEINSGYRGNWVIGFYIQDSETVNTFEISPAQNSAILRWNPQNYTQFRVEYKAANGNMQSVTTKDITCELTGLEASTKYSVSVMGSTDGSKYYDMFSDEFTTIPSVVSMPMIFVEEYEHSVGDVLDLRVVNSTDSDELEWFLDDVAVARGNKVVLNEGEHTISCKVTRGDKVYMIKRQINVN